MSDATLITQYSRAIEKYCDRVFTSTSYTEYVDGGSEFLNTVQYPIISITSITDTQDSTVVDSTDYDFYANSGMIFRKDNNSLELFAEDNLFWGPGRKRWKVIYTAGYASTPEDIKLAINMLVAMTRERTDPSIEGENVGDYQSQRALPAQGWPKEVLQLLRPYKKERF